MIVQYEINITGTTMSQCQLAQGTPELLIPNMLSMGTTFVKKNSCLVARIVSFDTVKLWNSIFLNSKFFLLTRMFTT